MACPVLLRRVDAALALLLLMPCVAAAQPAFAVSPGSARADVEGETASLGNGALQATWFVREETIHSGPIRDVLGSQTLPAPASPFVIVTKTGRAWRAEDFRSPSALQIGDLPPRPTAPTASERVGGRQLWLELENREVGLRVTWRAMLRDGSNYIRQEVSLAAIAGPVDIAEVRLIDWSLPNPRVVGTVKGSPIVADDLFAGFEHPLSRCVAGSGRARCSLERTLPLQPGAPVTYSSVIGVASAGQLRRAFLHYVERERAHPYRPFLHYNSWYDLGYFSTFDEAGALDRINTFTTELTNRRGVTLSSFLFDDGWDDPATLWQFNARFPDGFSRVGQAAQQAGAAPGVWLSPWGGYGKPREQRVAKGREAGYETVGNGFALSGPKYFRLFRDTCLDMIRRFGVNQFKIDGTGNANRVVAGSTFDSDFDAAIHLIGDLRAAKPDLYVNLTTGTFPSPFWLRYADSVWRGGEDHDFAGVGSDRQRWITYRDADTYQHVVLDGPLFPLNSLMLHGLIYARSAKRLDADPQRDFRSEIRSYFGSGTQLQEMYVTPSLLTSADWDDLAEAASWARRRAAALVDVHWVGGDPGELEVYGWAAWSREISTLVLRNPNDKAQSIGIDIGRVLELPPGEAREYRAGSPWKADLGQPGIELRAGDATTISLKPFEVIVLDVSPQPIARRPPNVMPADRKSRRAPSPGRSGLIEHRPRR